MQITGNGAKGPYNLELYWGKAKNWEFLKNQLKFRNGNFFSFHHRLLCITDIHCSLFKNVKMAAAKRDSTQLRNCQSQKKNCLDWEFFQEVWE